jgi:hypothetical protein
MFKFMKVDGRFLGIGFVLVALSSCVPYTPEKQLSNISLQMSPKKVESIMGATGHKGGSMIDKKGRAIEAWEYTVGRGLRTYYFYFCDGKLYQWGEPEDWDSGNTHRVEIKSSSDINLQTTSVNS